MDDTFTVKTTLYHRNEYFGSSPRALPNLNRLADVLIGKKCLDPLTTIGATELALLADINRPQALRLLKNRPGFTKTITLDGKARSVGWYFAPEFYEEARRQGSGYYPENNAVLANKPWPAEQVVSYVDAVEEVAPSGENVKLQTVRYEGHYQTKNPILVDVVSLTEEQVTKAYLHRDTLLKAIDVHLAAYAVAVKRGVGFDTRGLREQLVYLVSLVDWLREAQSMPERQLLLNDILKEDN